MLQEIQNPKLKRLLKAIKQNDKGQFLPDNKQLKEIVRYEEISLGQIDVSNITNMRDIFKDSQRMDFSGIEGWNVSKVASFSFMFVNAQYFNADISGWDTSGAKNFQGMFYRASVFNQPIGKWNTSNATNMAAMFSQARKFNQPIQSWDMSNVVWTWDMFRGAESFNQALNEWNVASVAKMQGMFLNAKAFNQPLDKWNISNVVDMQGLFSGAESFNQNLSEWGDKLGKVRNMDRAFADTKSLNIDFFSSWEPAEWCSSENLTKGSALDSQSSQNISAKESTMLDDFSISFVSGNDDVVSAFDKSWECKAFDDAYLQWLPNAIKKRYTVLLTKQDSQDDEHSLQKGNEKEWDFALCEVLGHYFLLSKNNKTLESNTDIDEGFKIFQKRKESEFEDFDTRAQTIESQGLKLYFGREKVWILNSAKTNTRGQILSVLMVLVLALAYKAEMEKLETEARENLNANVLQACYKKICEFDLQVYRNMPILRGSTLLYDAWRKIQEVYVVAQTHNELKEIISQMAQILGEDMREREGKRFNIAMGAIGFLSALGAILAAVPVIQSLI